MAALGVWGPAFVPFYLWWGAWFGAAVCTATVVMLWTVPTLLYRTGKVVAVAHYALLLVVIALALLAWEAGGHRAPSLVGMLVVPLLATAMMGPRRGAVWLIPTIASLAVFYWLDARGMAAPSQIASDDLSLPYGVVAVGVTTFLFSVATLYERLNDLNTVTLTRSADRLRNALQEAEAANTSKSMFLANMSHELRTPLNAILGYTELLQEEIEDETHRADLVRVHRAGAHLLALIDGVLDLSKIEAGRVETRPAPLDIETFVRDLGVALEPVMRANNNRYVVHMPHQAVLLVVDANALQRVLGNLLSNAAKFTHNGQVALDVAEAGDGLRIDVSDTGIGMSSSEIKRVFREFEQADASATRSFGGAGLGLAIARRYTQLMGGRLTATSQPGVGSTFTLHLPRPQRSAGERRPRGRAE